MTPIKPRDWQVEAAVAFAEVAARRRGARAIIAAWMGSGKSELSFMIAQNLGRRVLFLVNTDALAEQTEKRARKHFPTVGVVKAQRDEGDKAFVVASLQTLSKPDRLDSLVEGESSVGPFDLVVVDECHGARKGSVADLVLQRFPERPALGLTATAWRLDGSDLGQVFTDGIVYRYGRDRAEADGHVVPITDGEGRVGEPRRVIVPGLDVKAAIAAALAGNKDKDAVRKAYGDKVWPIVARESARVAHDFGMKKIVTFTPDVESAHIVADLSSNLGVKSEAIDGGMAAKERKKILAAHRSGAIEHLVNCMVVTVGYDDPGIQAGLWARATESWSLFWQAVGRVIRADPANPAKKSALLVDFVGAFDAHRETDLDTVYNGAVEDGSVEVEVPEGEREEQDEEREKQDRKVALWRGLIACLSGSRALASPVRKNVAWLPVKDDASYVFGGADGCMYVIESVGDGLWVPIREPRERGAPAVRLAKPTTRERAQEVAESAGNAGAGIDARDAKWRERSASEKMLNALAKWRVPVLGALAAGDASDLLAVAIAKARRRDRRERGVVSGAAEFFE